MKSFIRITLAFLICILYILLLPRKDVYQEEDYVRTEIERLINSADSLRAEKKIDSAILLAETAAEMIEREGGKFDSLYAHLLLRLGKFHSHRGLYTKAIQYYSQCLDVSKEESWLDQSTIADVIRRLGASHRVLGHYSEAESFVNQAISLLENASKPDQFVLGKCLRDLGCVYRHQLRHREAELSYNRALAISSSGRLNPKTRFNLETTTRARLGNLYFDQGRLAEAESQYLQTLKLADENRRRGRQSVSEFLDDLGKVYEEQGRYEDAEDHYREALKIRERELGLTHPWLVYHLLNLADVQVIQRKYWEASSNCFRSLKIIEKAGYGLRHPQVARAKRILGDSYRGQGKQKYAEKFYREAVEICKQIFGKYHPEVASGLEGLGLLYASAGEYARSQKVYQDLLETKHHLTAIMFSRSSQAQKMRYVHMYPPIDYSLYSLALDEPSERLTSLALEMTLKGKAVVIDALSKEQEIARFSHDPNTKRAWERWSNIIDEISSIYVASGDLEALSEQLVDTLHVLQSTRDSLEAELSKHSQFRLLLAEFEVNDIADLLPEGAVLWEFVHYRPFDFSRLRNNPWALGSPRYLVFMLDWTGKTILTDLGEAEKIDGLINLARNRISLDRAAVRYDTSGRLEESLTEVTGKLYKLVLAPLLNQIGENKEIFISPDGQLNLLPFEILPCPNGEYVLEKFRVSYLSSGRDLLKLEAKPKRTDSALVMADPDFNLCEESTPQKPVQSSGKRPAQFSVPQPLRGGNGCLEVPFDRLHNTEHEARSICRILRVKAGLHVDAYFGADAREDILKGIASAPRILHIATHGFFCEDTSRNRLLGNPLLRAGLAFTSANCLFGNDRQGANQREDGILTALEFSGLNLVGTELVTLSACETGVGEVKNGEGVYGLKHAFQHAGARTIVMSLWKVRDEETCEFMVSFYETWLAGKTKKEALREAALKVKNSCRAKYGNTHPYFWGGFVLLGDPN
jgi:CHAT domain-containing protein/tetratricopeptide (TPR) repeat protein